MQRLQITHEFPSSSPLQLEQSIGKKTQQFKKKRKRKEPNKNQNQQNQTPVRNTTLLTFLQKPRGRVLLGLKGQYVDEITKASKP